MKKYLFPIFAALCMSLSACSDNDDPTPEQKPEEPDTPEQTDAFQFEEKEVTTRTAVVRVVPEDVTSPYVAFILTREMFEQITPEFFIQQMFDEYEDADLRMTDELIVGPKDIDGYRMVPGTEYTLAVFGCSVKGEATSEVFYHHFTTRTKALNPVDVTFAFKIEDLVPDGATIQVTPSNNDVVYAVYAGESAIIEAFNGDLLQAAQYMVVYAESDGQVDWGNYDSSNNIRKGPASLNYHGMLGGNKDQAVIAFAINKWGEVISEVGYEAFRTPAPEASTCTFDFDLRNLTFNSVDVTITPSERVTYYADVAVKSFMQDMTDEEFMQGMISQYVMQSAIPYEVEEHGGLAPDTDYVAFGFAAAAGCPTTKLFKLEFRTPSFVFKSGGEAWVEQSVMNIADGSLYNSPGYGFIDVIYRPNEHTVEYFMAMPPIESEDAWFALSEDELKRTIILNPYSNDHSADNHAFWVDELGRTSTLYVVGMDADGNFGKVNEMKFKVELSGTYAVDTFSSAARWLRIPDGNGKVTARRTPVDSFTRPAAAMK